MPTNREDYEALRRYLLDEQSEPEADRLERRLLADGELAELADAVEEELIEACAREEIPRQRCAGLLERLAATPAGREKLAFYRALGNVTPEPIPVSILAWLQQRAPVWRPALAAAALVVAVAGVTWMVHGPWEQTTGHEVTVEGPAEANRAGGGNVPPVLPPKEDQAVATATEIEEPAGTEPQAVAEVKPPAPEAVATAKPPLPDRPSAPEPQLVEAIRSSLALAMLRGPDEIPTVTVGPGRPLKIDVDLGGPEDYRKFRVTIVPISGGEPVWSSGDDDVAVENDGALLVLRLPAGLLAEGDHYLLKVEGVKEADTEQVDVLGERKFKVVAQ